MAKKNLKEQHPKEMTRRALSHYKQQQRRQRIIFISGVAVIAAIIIIIAAGWLLAEFLPLHRTVLKVNDVDMSMGYYIDVIKILKSLDQSNPPTSLDELASTAIQSMEQTEVLRQGAELLGMKVDEKAAADFLTGQGLLVTDNGIRFVGPQLLAQTLSQDYFDKQVPQAAKQVNTLMMMVESEQVARELRQKLVNGDNFTAMAAQYAQNYYTKSINKGEFGWHPAVVYKEQTGTDIPVDYAFSAAPGQWSQPLADNVTYKQIGYWLLNVRERFEELDADNVTAVSANVSGLLISSETLAREVKARLEAGEDLAGLAAQYTQHSLSRENQGELGKVNKPVGDNTTISKTVDTYVFSENTALGRWSEPIRDDLFWTQGGSWLVKVLETEENRQISQEDRDLLVKKAYDEWITKLFDESGSQVDNTLLTDEMRRWAINKTTEQLGLKQGS